MLKAAVFVVSKCCFEVSVKDRTDDAVWSFLMIIFLSPIIGTCEYSPKTEIGPLE